METFALAAIGLAIAVSLLLQRKRDAVDLRYAALCTVLFVEKMGAFLYGIAPGGTWKFVHLIGLVAIPPFLFAFSREFLDRPALLRRAVLVVITVIAVLIAFLSLTAIPGIEPAELILGYILASTAYIAFVLLSAIRSKAGAAKKRYTHTAYACLITALVFFTDLASSAGYPVPPLSDIALAGLIYFVLIVISNPVLSAFYEMLARSFIVLIRTLFATAIFYFVLVFFGQGFRPPFLSILMASFIIILFVSPFKVMLKKLFSRFFPESKEYFQSLYSFDEELEREKSVMLEEMGTVMAHEIRNPLGSIKGAAQCIRSETETEENRKLLDVIIEEADRLNGVVSQFLNYARPYGIKPEPGDINEVIEKAISLIRANNLSERIRIEKDLHSPLPPVLIDGQQMLQVMLNIVMNGIDAMPEGGTLSFRTTRIDSDDESAVAISIRDTGRGIAKDDLANIFKPFFTTKKRGVGLGLAICQRIIKSHRGDIRVKSLPGQGTVFYIRLAVA